MSLARKQALLDLIESLAVVGQGPACLRGTVADWFQYTFLDVQLMDAYQNNIDAIAIQEENMLLGSSPGRVKSFPTLPTLKNSKTG